jgi:simple sugar transport system substrate-binding protein
MQVYLEKKVGLSPSDIDSGEAVFTPEQADQLMGLAKQGLR